MYMTLFVYGTMLPFEREGERAKFKCANSCSCNKSKCKNKVSLIEQLDY